MPNMLAPSDSLSFVSSRLDAWHQLGATLPEGLDAEQALKTGRLSGWNVRKTPLQTVVPETGEIIPLEGRYSILRDSPITNGAEVLGIMSDRYEILQNEEMTGLLDMLAEESGATFETAGELKSGCWALVTLKMPYPVKIGGVDPVDMYLTVLNTHNGDYPTTVMVAPTRRASASVLNLPFQNAKNAIKVNHSRAALKTLADRGRNALDFAYTYLESFEEEAEKLMNTAMTQAQFEHLIAKEFGAPASASAGVQTRAAEKMDDMVELFAHADSQENIRDTAWAGLNALTEYADHFMEVRPGEDGDAVEARSKKAIFDPGFKTRARQLILSAI